MKKFLALSFSDVVFIMLINVKMPTIVGILTFMSRIISCSAELSIKKFITSRLEPSSTPICYMYANRKRLRQGCMDVGLSELCCLPL